MVTKKPIFARRRTRPSRLLLASVWASVAVFLGLVLGQFLMFYNAVHAPQEPLISTREYQGVAVFTGGQNRIQTGFDLLSRFPKVQNVLISGVNPQSSRENLLASFLPEDGNFKGSVQLDYEARTTYGNVIQTKAWVDENEIDKLIIVTSNYHIPRAKALADLYLDDINVSFYPVVAERIGLRLLVSEFVKYKVVALSGRLSFLK